MNYSAFAKISFLCLTGLFVAKAQDQLHALVESNGLLVMEM